MHPYFKLSILVFLTTLSTLSLSHDGHGLEGSHWHASDAWGFVAFAAVTALAMWFGKGGDQ